MSAAAPALSVKRPVIRLRPALLTAAGLLAVLAAVAALVDLGHTQRVVAETSLALPDSANPVHDDPTFVRYTPVFEVERPSTVHIELLREGRPGWVAVGCTLLSEDTGETRELVVQTSVLPGAGGDVRAEARIDRVMPGSYSLRLAPMARELVAPAPVAATAVPTPAPPAAARPGHPAQVRVTVGGRSPFPFILAAGLIVLPALVTLVRWARLRRSEKRA